MGISSNWEDKCLADTQQGFESLYLHHRRDSLNGKAHEKRSVRRPSPALTGTRGARQGAARV